MHVMRSGSLPRLRGRVSVGAAGGTNACLRAPAAVLCAMFLSFCATAQDISLDRQHYLVRMVRQDCGSCHGLLLTGGLGPPLTPTALRDWPIDSLTATILHGRPGTPMPPWSRFVTEAEATWIARNLRDGFPKEHP